jgi:hypothetical protein
MFNISRISLRDLVWLLVLKWSPRYILQQRDLGRFTMALGEYETPKTLSVPEAGKRYFGLSRGSSYAAAREGTIPTIRVGRLLKVPVIALERILERVGQRPE